MKRFIHLIAAVLGCASASWGATPAALTTLRTIHTLTNNDASKGPPVAFEATVSYRRQGETTLFVQDGDAAIYVWAKPDFKMVPGDRVLVRGKAQGSFRPIVIADNVTVLRHGDLPRPVPATFDELIRSQRDCMRVTVRARVQSADLVLSSSQVTTRIQLLADGGLIDAYINSGNASALNALLDAEVLVTGVATARFDGKMQQTGAQLAIPTLADVKIVRRAQSSPWTLPLTEMDGILDNYHVRNLSRRVRVHGIITYYQPGSALVLQSGAKSLSVMTAVEGPLRVGSEADVTGFPEVHDGFLVLTGGEVKESAVYTPIAPKPATWSQLASSKSLFDLVSIEGQLVTEVREGAQDEYVLVSDGQMFSAIYHHPETGGAPEAPMNRIQLGSRVRVTGICALENSNPFDRQVPFEILMRAPGDIEAIAGPSPLNVRNLALLAGLLLVMVVAFGARSWALERKVRRQTAAAAALERRRSRILEDINGSRPTAEVLEEITEMVSFTLKGAPCWCEIAGGAHFGRHPANSGQWRIVREEIPGRAGPPLGSFAVALDPRSRSNANELELLSKGVELAALAIETRRLYSDLRHRSEFDLLTDIHNRFSLETHLDAQIEAARQSVTIFGLVYIDLDRFKEINDLYGHHIGDQYLQEVARRMKSQLRPGDLLARVGGDEFAVLVPAARNRAEVEEIARRLGHSFDAPFAVLGDIKQGSASMGIAFYPEDGVTRDSLLSAADAAMYVAKNAARQPSA